MFTTCIYCHQPLGQNEAIEEFPVGRRLAFDGAVGRLWVVCRGCERWNLSPIETRWEAIEACERAFSMTRMRVSTDNIGLARLTEGLELVRIGAPQRPEFAAWRYGDQFGRRRRRSFVVGGAVVVGLGAVLVAGSAAGIGMGSFGGIWGNLPNMMKGFQKVRLRTESGELLTVRGTALAGVKLIQSPDADLPRLSIPRRLGKVVEFEGAEALRVAGRLLPKINSAGGNKKSVQEAVEVLQAYQSPEELIQRKFREPRHGFFSMKPQPLSALPVAERLALEMALHEEAERRAIEGELGVLLAAWQEAEAIASIADKLLVPEEVEARLAELKGGPPTL